METHTIVRITLEPAAQVFCLLLCAALLALAAGVVIKLTGKPKPK